ncbi:MAG: ATP-dependent metallopeptidase FtsH/Yme1/Tma family protein [Marinilabiliaceae bacterium]|nr:ATP-dependent metallopeptidase FtsH/Yme1/Tma family protein [Marinilabiliaceae bacterium]
MQETNKKNPSGGNNKFKFNPYWIYGIIVIVLIFISSNNTNNEPQVIDYSTFSRELLPSNDIKKIVVVRNENKAEVTLNEKAIEKHKSLFKNDNVQTDGPHFVVDIPSIDSFEARRNALENDGNEFPSVSFESRSKIWTDVLAIIWPLFFILLIYFFFFRKVSGSGGGIFSVGKSRAKMLEKDENVNVTFKDVAGLDGAKEELEEIVEFLRKPAKYTELGGKIPKGAILVGPPGTGKTLLAKAVAGEANVPFFSMSGSDFVEMFVGVGASRVRDLFQKAKSKAPSIVFIDEIDAIGRARGRSSGYSANEERENTLNQLLTEMDGFGTNSGVIIIAATNRVDILDRALLRAGRFDRQISVELPDINEREAIFNVHLRPLKLEEGFERTFLAKQTPGFSGADIANVCNEAALTAARKNKKEINKQDFLDAIDRIVGGLEKKNKIITEEERRTIAIHEAGHASISWLLQFAHPLVKVTIVPRGKALGAAWYLPEERQLTTTEQLLDEMCSTLGGRAAEEVVFGRISTGALNDLEKVTQQAYAMIRYYGMSKEIPNISYYDSTGQQEYALGKPYSESRAQIIDKEVSKIIEEQYERAKRILCENAEKHQRLAELLLEREVIFSDDLEEIYGPRPWNSKGEEKEKTNETEPEDSKIETEENNSSNLSD